MIKENHPVEVTAGIVFMSKIFYWFIPNKVNSFGPSQSTKYEVLDYYNIDQELKDTILLMSRDI